MNDTPVTEAMCAARRQLDDERFARDKSRLGKAEARLNKLEDLMHEISECNVKLTALIEKNAETVDDHEERLTEIEKKPGTYWDKVIAGIIGAAVAALMALVLSGGAGV
jgi:septation ring formation regulator EzrA